MNDEMLIEQVRQYEELYNMTNRKYMDNIHKDKIWTKIAKELNSTGPACKARWVCLRDQLRKALKKKTTKSGQEAKTTKKWRFEDSMSFLIPFFKERDTQGNVPTPETSADDDSTNGDGREEQQSEDIEDAVEVVEDNDPLISKAKRFTIEKSTSSTRMPAPRSTKLGKSNKKQTASSVLMNYLIDSNKQEIQASPSTSFSTHPIDIFFNGLAATVKNFSPEYQHLAKSKLFAVVSELEWAQLQNQNPSCYVPLPTTPSTLYQNPNRSTPLQMSTEQYERPQIRRHFGTFQPSTPTSQYLYDQTSTPSPSQRSGRSSAQSLYENFSSEINE